MNDRLKLQQGLAVLSSQQVYITEKKAVSLGLTLEELMERAGTAVFQQTVNQFHPTKTLVVCGPGNNGGDGYVVARKLLEQGWDVCVARSPASKISDCAQQMLDRYNGPIVPFSPESIDKAELIIDGIFGIGLSKPITGEFKAIIDKINQSNKPVVAIDIPSGINADNGEVFGCAINATLTVTFNFKKPGHLLLPGKVHNKKVVVSNIGLPMQDVEQHKIFINHKNLWQHLFPLPNHFSNKYTRGHLAIIAGSEITGAPRLAAIAARRTGVGLVTMICPEEVRDIYAISSAGPLIKTYKNIKELLAIINNSKFDGFVAGPGLLPNAETKKIIAAVLKTSKPAVIDAGGISAYKDNPDDLKKLLHKKSIITPHEGEFKRVFALNRNKIEAVQDASASCKSTVLLKGADTVISDENGFTFVQDISCPYLATGGTGDVQSGMIASLLVQGIAPNIAGAMASWFLNRAGLILGYGLIAEDIPSVIPRVVHEDIISLAGSGKNV